MRARRGPSPRVIAGLALTGLLAAAGLVGTELGQGIVDAAVLALGTRGARLAAVERRREAGDVRALLRALGDEAEDVRVAAIGGLASARAQGPGAIARLLERSGEGGERERGFAIHALIVLAPEDERTAVRSLEALERPGVERRSALAGWIDALSGGEASLPEALERRLRRGVPADVEGREEQLWVSLWEMASLKK